MSRQPDPESLQILPLLNTEEVLHSIGEGEWKNPGDIRNNSQSSIDRNMLEWIRFCESAKKGEKIYEGFKEGRLSGDLMSLGARGAFEDAFNFEGEKVEFPEIITTIESAFAQLLSAEGSKKLTKAKIEIKKIVVDETVRRQVNALVKGMGPITDVYIAGRRRMWNELDGD